MELVEREQADLTVFGTSELKEQLAVSLKLTVKHVARAASIIRELQRRGEDLGDMRTGLMKYLAAVANGRLLPEVVLKLGCNPSLVDRLIGMPAPVQARMLSGEPIKVLAKRRHATGDDAFEFCMVEPKRLMASVISQVLARDHIRDDEEQRGYLEKPPPTRGSGRPRVTVDKDRAGIIVCGLFVPLGDLEKFVEMLRNNGNADAAHENK